MKICWRECSRYLASYTLYVRRLYTGSDHIAPVRCVSHHQHFYTSSIRSTRNNSQISTRRRYLLVSWRLHQTMPENNQAIHVHRDSTTQSYTRTLAANPHLQLFRNMTGVYRGGMNATKNSLSDFSDPTNGTTQHRRYGGERYTVISTTVNLAYF